MCSALDLRVVEQSLDGTPSRESRESAGPDNLNLTRSRRRSNPGRARRVLVSPKQKKPGTKAGFRMMFCQGIYLLWPVAVPALGGAPELPAVPFCAISSRICLAKFCA